MVPWKGTCRGSSLKPTGEGIGWFVGGAPDITLPGEGFHEFAVHEMEGGLIHVRVRLFAQLGGPEYLVVAGRRIEPPPS